MDSQAAVAAPVNQAGGQEIGRKRHGQKLGDAQPAAAGEATHSRQPTDGRAHYGSEDALPQHQKQGAANLSESIGPQTSCLLLATEQRLFDQGKQRQAGQQADPHHHGNQSGPAAAGVTP